MKVIRKGKILLDLIDNGCVFEFNGDQYMKVEAVNFDAEFVNCICLSAGVLCHIKIESKVELIEGAYVEGYDED